MIVLACQWFSYKVYWFGYIIAYHMVFNKVESVGETITTGNRFVLYGS